MPPATSLVRATAVQRIADIQFPAPVGSVGVGNENSADDLERRGIGLKILDQQIDTTTPNGKLLFHILGSLAEFERSLIRERTQAGRKRAMAAGVQMGLPSKLSAEDIKRLRVDYSTCAGDKRELAKRWCIGKSTMYRLWADT